MTIVARDVERILVVIFGGASIYFGYRLFYLIKQKQGDLRIQGKEFKLSLSDVAPGIYFALFGSLLLTFNLFSSTESQRTETHRSSNSGEATTTLISESHRGLGSGGFGGETFSLEDPDNDVRRDYTPKSKREDILKLRAYRNVLRQSLGDGTAKDFWRPDALEQIRAVLKPLVQEPYFENQLSNCKDLKGLRIFLEYYVTYFYHTYSSPMQ
jgi:hypothetical protein